MVLTCLAPQCILCSQVPSSWDQPFLWPLLFPSLPPTGSFPILLWGHTQPLCFWSAFPLLNTPRIHRARLLIPRVSEGGHKSQVPHDPWVSVVKVVSQHVCKIRISSHSFSLSLPHSLSLQTLPNQPSHQRWEEGNWLWLMLIS